MSIRVVPRPRLVELLATRWHQRVVAIVAGPGFGKSVLLAHAMSENMLAPRGVDVLIRCNEADSTPSHFLARIADSLGEDTTEVPSSLTVEWLFAELTRRWPLGVCLLVDDAHHVCARPRGAQQLTQMVASAPSSVRFVLASRSHVRGLAVLRAAGEVLDVDEDDLSLSASETVQLAALYRVDPSVPASAGGWPAAATMAAAYGVSGAHEYVFESVLEHLDAFDRKVLAVAAAIGGGDPDVLRAAVGRAESDPADVLARLPLVTTSESGEFVVHDLWRRVLGEALDRDEVVGAVARAVDALVEREDFNRAFELCIERGDWQAAADALGSCCRRGHAVVRLDVLTRWLDVLPTERRGDPDGLLLRGLLRRVTNPFEAETAKLLERAVAGYRAAGNVVGEVAAGVELVYVLRNQGRTESLPVFLARATELAEQGHSIAAGPAAVGRALLAELSGDDRKMLALLDAIPDGSLSPDWASVVAFRQAIGHLTLGDEQGMVDAAQRCARLAGQSADRHVVALVEWFAGNPLPALRTAEAMDVDASRSQINAVILGSIRTMVLASAGLVDEAARRLAETERAVSGSASALMLGALVGIRALLAAAQGDDDRARRVLEESLQAAPLTDPVGWRMSARWLPLAYVLVPSTREHLDHRPTGVVHSRRLDVARAVVASLEGFATLPPAARALAPASVATTVPLPWAMALAARLTADGDVGGRALVEYLFALYGEPARDAVRAAATHADPSIVDGARRLLASITIAPRHSIRLGVLGPVTLQIGDGAPVNDHWNRDRVRSLLVYLVIHGPAQRDQILEALWPHLDPGAADRNLRVTLSYLHQVLEPDRRKGEAPFYVRQTGPTLSLADDPHLVVDLHEFESALERADDADHRGLPSVALELLERALRLWRGRCLTDVADEDWAQPTCRRLTDRYVTAAVRAGELHFAAGRGTSAVHDARRALMADPWCEPAHCLLVAIGLARGDTSAAAQALAECDATLADLGVTGGPQIEMLRRRLRGGAPSMAIRERSVRRRDASAPTGKRR